MTKFEKGTMFHTLTTKLYQLMLEVWNSLNSRVAWLHSHFLSNQKCHEHTFSQYNLDRMSPNFWISHTTPIIHRVILVDYTTNTVHQVALFPGRHQAFRSLHIVWTVGRALHINSYDHDVFDKVAKIVRTLIFNRCLITYSMTGMDNASTELTKII